jgi:uncharacterized protein YegP (UPF0339 family)
MKNPKFQIHVGKDCQFYFRLRAANGEVILSSEGYVSKSGCQNGIASVKENSSNDQRYQRKTAADGQFYFALVAANGEVIGMSEMYKSQSARDGGIDAVKRTAPEAPVEDTTWDQEGIMSRVADSLRNGDQEAATESWSHLIQSLSKSTRGVSESDVNHLIWQVISKSRLEALENEIKEWEEKLNTVGDDAQLANVDLRNMLQKQQQTLQMLASISKILHDTALAVIRKME